MEKRLAEQYQTSSNLEARIQLHERFSVAKERWPSWLFDQMVLPTTCRILELGCGVGKLWLENLGRVPSGWTVTLSDFSEGMIKQAKRNVAGSGRDFHFAVFDATDIPFQDDYFDAVMANHMLYHVPDLNKTLAKIRHVLKRSGKLYAATNGQNHMRELDELTAGHLPHTSVGDVINNFTLENGRRSLERFFADVELHRHEDSLLVTEVAPLVEYALSRLTIFTERTQVDESTKQAFSQHVAGKMQGQGGVIQITKDSGLFVALNRR